MKLIITRPQPAASRTAIKLQNLGYETIVSPVLEIVDTGAEIPQADYAALIITSANALGILEQRGLSDLLRKTPLFVVGDATAEKAQLLGFTRVDSASGTAIELADLIVQKVKPTGGKAPIVLYLSGEDTTSGLATSIEKSGLNLSAVAIYNAKLVDQLTEKSMECLRNNAPVGLLLYSARSAVQIAKIIERFNLTYDIDNAKFYAISENVMHGLPDTLQQQCVCSEYPTENGLIDLIRA